MIARMSTAIATMTTATTLFEGVSHKKSIAPGVSLNWTLC
jgi:hypothetical protein